MGFALISGDAVVGQAHAQRVVVADDHPLFREALKEVLSGLQPGVECVDISDYDQLLDVVHSDVAGFAVIFVDLLMPGSEDLEALQSLRAATPDTPTVVISAREDTVTIRRAMACGVAGYIAKSTPKAELEAAITRILDGGVYFPSQLNVPAPTAAISPANQLTPRQSAVLEQLACGRSNRQIAQHLGIEEITVKAHISAILRKLNVKNRLQAVVSSRSLLAQWKDVERAEP